MEVQFILFGEIVTGIKHWFYDLDLNKIDFVNKLQKTGDVIILNPNYSNFYRFSKTKPDYKDIHKKIRQ
jgi:hypothetical protein